jgi:membrane protein DedA with SNARE-associated domain
VIPGDTVVLVAATGATSTEEYISLIVVIIIGALIGESIGFALGHAFGPAIQHSKVGKWIGHKNWKAAERFLEHRGGWAIFISRFLPVLHSIVPLTAGITGMEYRRFIAWTAPACTLWAIAYVTVGRTAALTYEQLSQSLHFAGFIFAGIIVLFIAVMALVKKSLHRYTRHPDD